MQRCIELKSIQLRNGQGGHAVLRKGCEGL